MLSNKTIDNINHVLTSPITLFISSINTVFVTAYVITAWFTE